MAIINAAATGNWSSTSTWPGGVLPTADDDVHANGYTVTIDQDVTVLSISTSNGGKFVPAASGSYTITADIIAGTTNCLEQTSGTAALTIIGDITGGTTGGKYGITTGLTFNSGTYIDIIGNISGGTVNSYGIHGAHCFRNITGDIKSGTASGSYGAYIYYASLTITGNIYIDLSMVNGVANNSLYLFGNSGGQTLSVIGNITSGPYANQTAVVIAYSMQLVEISGDITGIGSYAVHFSMTMTANTVFLSGDIINSGSYAIYNPITNTPFIVSGNMISSSSGMQPINGCYKILSDSNSTIQIPNTTGGTEIFQVSPYPTDYPAESDVRDGIEYNHGINTGACYVPIPDNVSLGIPVDDTIGTAVLRAEDLNIDLTPISEKLDQIMNIAGTSGFDRTTDSLEAIRNRVDDVMIATGTPIGYAPTSAIRTIGSDQGGTYTDLESHDAVFFATGEVSGTGLDVLITRAASEITENPSLVRVSGYYAGSTSHWIDVQLYDYVTDNWETKGRMTSLSESFNYLFPMSPDNHDISTGEMKIRFLHNTATYFTNHRLYLDFVSFEKVNSNSQIASDLASIAAKTAQFNFSAGKVLARNEDSEKIASQTSVDTVDGIVDAIASMVDAIEVNVSNLSSTLVSYGDGHIFSAIALQNAPVCDLDGVALEETVQAVLVQTDVKTSTRLAALDYVALDNAGITAIKAKTDNLPDDPADESLLENALEELGAAILEAVSSITDGTTPGTGLYPVNVSVQESGGSPIASARVEMWNQGGTLRVGSDITDAGGTAAFSLDEGIYQIRVSLIGWDFTVPASVTHAEPSTDVTVIGSSISIGTPEDSALCRVWMYCFDQAGQNPLPSVKATAYLINNPVFHSGKALKKTVFPPNYAPSEGVLYWDIPRLTSAHLIVEEVGLDREVPIPDKASAAVEELI